MNFGGSRQLEGDKMASKFNSLAYGEVMAAAAKNLQKEWAEQEKAVAAANQRSDLDMEELADDPELERLHRERLNALKEEAEKRVKQTQKGHGAYNLVEEADFLPAVTQSDCVVAHFFHDEFERCKIVDKHMQALAQKYFETRFIRVIAPDAPFFVEKLGVRVLPCVVMFKDGVAFDRIVGFEEFGGKDDFTTTTLENRLLEAHIVKKQKVEDEEEEMMKKRSVYAYVATASDEDSDFDD